MTSLVLKGAVRCGRRWIGVLVSTLRVFEKVIEGYGAACKCHMGRLVSWEAVFVPAGQWNRE